PRRPVDGGPDADQRLPRLLEEAVDYGLSVRTVLLVTGQRPPRLEARVVNRRHELRREKGAHRLAYEVGRGDARDPEPVCDVGRDRGLAGSGGAADEQDDRVVEVVQAPVAAQRRPLPRAPPSR